VVDRVRDDPQRDGVDPAHRINESLPVAMPIVAHAEDVNPCTLLRTWPGCEFIRTNTEENELDPDAEEGQIVECTECGTEFEIVRTRPLSLAPLGSSDDDDADGDWEE